MPESDAKVVTQYKASKMTGIYPTTIAAWLKSGKLALKPIPGTKKEGVDLDDIAKLKGVPLDALLSNQPDMLSSDYVAELRSHLQTAQDEIAFLKDVVRQILQANAPTPEVSRYIAKAGNAHQPPGQASADALKCILKLAGLDTESLSQVGWVDYLYQTVVAFHSGAGSLTEDQAIALIKAWKPPKKLEHPEAAYRAKAIKGLMEKPTKAMLDKIPSD